MANLENLEMTPAENENVDNAEQLQILEEISEKIDNLLSSVSSDDTSVFQELQVISESLVSLQSSLDEQSLKSAELSSLVADYIEYQYDRDEYNDSLVDPDVDYQTYMKGSQSVLISLNLILLVVVLFFVGSYYAKSVFRRM